MQAVGNKAVSKSNSGNSLMSDITSTEFNNNSGHSIGLMPPPVPPSFNKVSKLSAISADGSPSPTKGSNSLLQQSVRNNALTRNNSHSMSSRQLAKQASKVFLKQIVEHISEEEAAIIYRLMAKHKIDREKAVRMFLEEHDERLYNPKAVYLFPGEEYVPPEEEDEEDEEEIRRKQQELLGRVEFHQKIKVEGDSSSECTPASVEQRLIGAKKDPDQEALEHAMLLSAQEQEFGINMYDSLSAADQLLLHEYVSQGFTREEGALIIFEEKFGKTSNSQFSSVIPAMPTLHAQKGGHSTATDPSGHSAGGGEDEEDDPEVQDLIVRGYTREQAMAVIQQHKERAAAAAAAARLAPADPTHYDPHPQEERFNLSEREEKEVEVAMQRRGCSRRVAVESVVQMRTTNISNSSGSVSSQQQQQGIRGSNSGSNYHMSSYDETVTSSAAYSNSEAAAGGAESYEVRQYMDRGYTREQALQLLKHKNHSSNNSVAGGGGGYISSNNSTTSDHRRRSNSSTADQDSSGEHATEVLRYMGKGYTREQALELVRRRRGDSAVSGGAVSLLLYFQFSTYKQTWNNLQFDFLLSTEHLE